MPQTKSGTSNNAWITYMQKCAQDYKQGKMHALTGHKDQGEQLKAEHMETRKQEMKKKPRCERAQEN